LHEKEKQEERDVDKYEEKDGMRCTVEYVKYENWHKDIAYTF
jgi:hypothetical protein